MILNINKIIKNYFNLYLNDNLIFIIFIDLVNQDNFL